MPAFRHHAYRFRTGLIWHGFEIVTLENEYFAINRAGRQG